MKVYSNFRNYFNTNPRFLLSILAWIIGVLTILGVVASIVLGLGVIMVVYSAVTGGLVFYGVMRVYRNQYTLVNAMIGRDLARRGYDVVAALDEIEEEISCPLLAQLHTGVNRSFNMMVTKNWLIGTDDLIAMRTSAIRLDTVVAIELRNRMVYSAAQASPSLKIRSKNYQGVALRDVDGFVHSFYVIDPARQHELFSFLQSYLTQRSAEYPM